MPAAACTGSLPCVLVPLGARREARSANLEASRTNRGPRTAPDEELAEMGRLGMNLEIPTP